MTTHKEALTLALDWFVCYQDKSMSRNNAQALAEEVVEAIKEALAQQEKEPAAIMREMLEVQGQHGNWNYDSYMHGLYNGMEYMVALAEKRETQFRDAPETWLAKYEAKRNNFNNTESIEAAHGIKGEE